MPLLCRRSDPLKEHLSRIRYQKKQCCTVFGWLVDFGGDSCLVEIRPRRALFPSSYATKFLKVVLNASCHPFLILILHEPPKRHLHVRDQRQCFEDGSGAQRAAATCWQLSFQTKFRKDANRRGVREKPLSCGNIFQYPMIFVFCTYRGMIFWGGCSWSLVLQSAFSCTSENLHLLRSNMDWPFLEIPRNCWAAKKNWLLLRKKAVGDAGRWLGEKLQ